MFLVLIGSLFPFAFFNWFCKYFYGDSAVYFKGIFGSFMLITVIENEVSIYTWIIIFGYFFADTTVTLITRLILVKKWYVAHRVMHTKTQC